MNVALQHLRERMQPASIFEDRLVAKTKLFLAQEMQDVPIIQGVSIRERRWMLSDLLSEK